MFCKKQIILNVRKFWKSEVGATAIEFSLVAIPLFALFFAIFQLGIIYLTNQSLDQAVVNAARLIKTGQVFENNINRSELDRLICERVVLIPNCTGNLELSVRSFTRLSDIAAAPLFDANGLPVLDNAYRPGDANDFVVVSAAVTSPVMFTNLFAANRRAGTGQRLVTSTVVQNEDF